MAPSDADTRSNYGQLLLDRNVAGKGRADAEAVWTRCLVRLVRVVTREVYLVMCLRADAEAVWSV